MTIVLQGINMILNLLQPLPQISSSRGHGMETLKVIFLSSSEWSLLLSPCALVVPATYLIFRAPEDIKVDISFWPILKVNATACPIVRIPGVFHGSPPRMTFN